MGRRERRTTIYYTRDSSNRAGCAVTAISQRTVYATGGRGRSCYYDYRGSGIREKQIKIPRRPPSNNNTTEIIL